jgi:hypothetical protein
MTAKTVNPKQTSALHEILTWSATRPEWQRDALRRIVEKGVLDNADILELERICRGKITIEAIKPTPMIASSLCLNHPDFRLTGKIGDGALSIDQFATGYRSLRTVAAGRLRWHL